MIEMRTLLNTYVYTVGIGCIGIATVATCITVINSKKAYTLRDNTLLVFFNNLSDPIAIGFFSGLTLPVIMPIGMIGFVFKKCVWLIK